MKPLLVGIGLVMLVGSFFILHWVSWLILIAGVAVTTFGVFSKK